MRSADGTYCHQRAAVGVNPRVQLPTTYSSVLLNMLTLTKSLRDSHLGRRGRDKFMFFLLATWQNRWKKNIAHHEPFKISAVKSDLIFEILVIVQNPRL